MSRGGRAPPRVPWLDLSLFLLANITAELVGVRFSAAVADRHHLAAGALSAASCVFFSLAALGTLRAASPEVAVVTAGLVRGVTAWAASRWGRPHLPGR